MRVSTNQFHSQGINSIQKHQEELLDLQIKLSTGKRVNKASDDPVATSQIHSLNRTMSTIEQYARNGEFAKTQLVLEETTISDTTDSLQRARELGVQMLNGVYNDENRQAAAEEVGQIISQVRNMMNYTSSEGEFLFAGGDVDKQPYASDTATYDDTSTVPIETATGFYSYIGNLPPADANFSATANYGSRFVQIGFDADNKIDPDDRGDAARVRITDNGSDVFDIPGGALSLAQYDDGSGNTPDSNILNVLIEMERNLVSGEPLTDDIVADISSSIAKLTQVRSEIGGRQNRIESQYDAGENFKLTLTERKSSLEDLDVIAGISDFTRTENALEVAQQVFSKVQSLSLFNYIR
ncbi:MAG: flagellar hook-associated protein 3 FlgL [Thiomicrorhabdus sp.]|nr:MAG: flagellar hook-associated protein 3 FlgL [Thiomicrorhabdus sp.]